MFIRKIKKRNGKTQKVYEYLHLIESVRTERGPRQRLVLNLGKLDIDRSQHRALARRIEDIITGQQSFHEIDKKVEKYACEVSRKIFIKQAQELQEKEADYQKVNVKSLETQTHRSIGAEYLCHSIWKELQIDRLLKREGVSRHVIPLIEALVVGRLVEPNSERWTMEWAEKRSALYELTGMPLRKSLNSYYRAGDKIYSLKESIEEYLSKKEKSLFSLSEKMIFIDLTNTYFEGNALKNPKAQRGLSKEKRKDCKLVTLGLIIDESGFVKYSQLFAGNQAEGKTLSQMIKNMEKNLSRSAKDITIVIDAGIATKENIQWLKSNKYHYIAVNRGNPPIDIDYSDMKVIKEDITDGIKIEVKRFKHGREVYIVCKSKLKHKKEASMRRRVEYLFIERLEYYKAGLTVSYRTKKYTKVLELIGRLKEKYPKAAKLYKVEVIPHKKKTKNVSGLLAKDIIWEKKELHEKEVEQEGVYILRTDRIDLSDKEIWDAYRMLGKVEYAFKSLKSHLGIRPNFHQIEQRVDTHMFISVLAYHLLQIIEYKLKSKGDNRSWVSILNILKTHERVTISYQSLDEQGFSKQHYIRVNSKLEPEHLEIYRKFNLSGVPLPRIKMSN